METVTEDDEDDTIAVDLPPPSQESSTAPATNAMASAQWTKVQRCKQRKKKMDVPAAEPMTATPPP